jgi:hypothetical protein
VRHADDDVLLQVHHNDDGVLGYLFLKLPDAVHREMLIVLTSFLLFWGGPMVHFFKAKVLLKKFRIEGNRYYSSYFRKTNIFSTYDSEIYCTIFLMISTIV